MTQIDINEFDAIRIGLASAKQIRDGPRARSRSPRRSITARLKPERDGLFCERIFGPTKDWECYCGKYKRVRYKGIICERCGVEVTRQKVRRERMGHIDLAAPVSHIWFFKGVPSRIGYLLDTSRRASWRRSLYFAASIVTDVDKETRQKDLADLEDKVRAEYDAGADVDHEEHGGARAAALPPPELPDEGPDRGFDEDDEFWGPRPGQLGEEQTLPTLEDVRGLVGGLFKEIAPKVTTEDAKKIRELVRTTVIRDDRRLQPRELENVAQTATEILTALAPLHKELKKATGSKKGAVTKHINRVLDGLLDGGDLNEEDSALVASVDAKKLESGRKLGKGLLREVVTQAEPGSNDEQIRELTNDLCLRTDGKLAGGPRRRRRLADEGA